jgi:membrane-associated phospholipid phosphatase
MRSMSREQFSGTRLRRLTTAVPVGRLREPRLRALVAYAIAFAASIVAFARIAEDYLTGDPLADWDVRFAVWLHDHTTSDVVAVFKLVTQAGNAVVLGALVLCVGAVLWRRGAANDAALLGAVVFGAEAVNAALKLAFHRPRPELAFLHLETYSFPSGHSTAATAAFGAVAFLLWPRAGTVRRRVALVMAAVGLICLVGFSRLYLGVHYLSDVLAGFALGAVWLSLCLFTYAFFGDRDVRVLLRRRARAVPPPG